MAEPVYLINLQKVTPDGTQYVKTWRVTREMEKWVDAYLGAPHAETVADSAEVAAMAAHATSVMTHITEAGDSDGS